MITYVSVEESVSYGPWMAHIFFHSHNDPEIDRLLEWCEAQSFSAIPSYQWDISKVFVYRLSEEEALYLQMHWA